MSNSPSDCWVVPFGNPRIKGYLHLPEAYRSLSRPSSPPWAKASAMRPFLLSLWYQPLRGYCYPWSAEPLILSAVLIVKYSLLSIAALRSTSLKLKLKSYFLQFVLCQYVKDLFSVHGSQGIVHSYASGKWLKVWRITDSNRWPLACKASALANWANPPVGLRIILFRSSPRQTWTADLHIISVAL